MIALLSRVSDLWNYLVGVFHFEMRHNLAARRMLRDRVAAKHVGILAIAADWTCGGVVSPARACARHCNSLSPVIFRVGH